MRTLLTSVAILALAACATAPDPQSPKVKITSLGSHDGEFCPLDRAMVFEDPGGTRILYDAGRTVRGPNDPRLGRIDAILLSHVHGDHLGDLIQPSANAGTCPKPDFSVNVTPNSNMVNISLGKQAPMIVGGEMGSFLSAKVSSLGGDPDVGEPGGFVLRFSNGLTVYLSGDTGITAEQDLVVMNIGGFPFTTGPAEAAYVVNDLVRPASVIASHANEPATVNGQLSPTSRTATFRNAAKMPVHVPLSGKTMEFDGSGRCTSGC
jgi:L-ascorbate metabolism protein UlaG (beta-lactamase superfamily)